MNTLTTGTVSTAGVPVETKVDPLAVLLSTLRGDVWSLMAKTNPRVRAVIVEEILPMFETSVLIVDANGEAILDEQGQQQFANPIEAAIVVCELYSQGKDTADFLAVKGYEKQKAEIRKSSVDIHQGKTKTNVDGETVSVKPVYVPAQDAALFKALDEGIIGRINKRSRWGGGGIYTLATVDIAAVKAELN